MALRKEMMMLLKSLAGCALALMMAGAASATVTVTMSGTTNSSGISGTGSTFTATMVYDELAHGSASSNNSSNYSYVNYQTAVQSMTFSSGAYSSSLSLANATAANYQVLNSTSNQISDYIIAFLQNSSGAYLQNNFQGPYTTIDTTSLISPSAFGNTGSNVFYASNASNNYVGQITSFSVSQSAVPEPAAWTMMIVGFGAVGYAMRRQHKVSVNFG